MATGSASSGNAAEIDRLALALAKEPGSKAFIPLAEEYGKAGMWQEAVGVLEDGLKVYPNFIIAMVALGRAYDQLNLPIKARAILEEAIKLSPENLRAHRTLAKIYVMDKANDAALRSCAVILAANPQDREARSIQAALATADPRMPARPSAAIPDVRPEPILPMQVDKPAVTPPDENIPTGMADTPPAVVTTAAPPTARQMYVRQLERWLAGIQARRRPGQSIPSQS
jgi:tetratricopeptide (TPR) repeat protein